MSDYKISPSKCQLEDFNSCLGSEKILKIIGKDIDIIKIIDIDHKDYWKNSCDTFVFSTALNIPITLAQSICDICPDEFDIIKINDEERIVRLWWD